MFMGDGADRAGQIELLCRLVREHYVFPEVATEVVTALRRRGGDSGGDTGDGADDEQFAAMITSVLQSVNRDPHRSTPSPRRTAAGITTSRPAAVGRRRGSAR